MFRLPLHGVRVLDLTMSWAGPYATRLLGDMGAEVIKIEGAAHWDLLRTFTGRPPDVDQIWERSPYFAHINRNKYGLALDITKPRGRELFLDLVALSDVVIENYRADVMDNLGLSYEAVVAVNARIVYVSMPGHGKTGREKDYVAFGSNVEQLAGLAALTGYEGGPPHKTGISYGDPVAGTAAAGSIAAALFDRRRTGRGGYIEVAQRENLTGLIGEQIVAYSITGEEPPRRGNRHTSMAPHGVYRSAGGDDWIAIACEDDSQFAALCTVIGSPQLARDERFAVVIARYRNQDAIDAIIGEWTASRTKEQTAEALQSAGVPAMPVLSVPEVFTDEHLRARGFYESVTHPVAGTWEIEGPHWRMSETPAHIRLPAPCFGEHNHYVFRELLGLSADEVARLEADGVTATAPDWSVHE
ncbi:MAG: CoA transferase [Dehalococcoidia bacterium]